MVDGYISMFEVDKLSSFFTKLSKITWGHHEGGGVSDTQCDAPILFFSKNKNYLPNQMHTTTPPTPHHIKITPTNHSHQHPPQRKSGALMLDISWAPPHSLPIR